MAISYINLDHMKQKIRQKSISTENILSKNLILIKYFVEALAKRPNSTAILMFIYTQIAK